MILSKKKPRKAFLGLTLGAIAAISAGVGAAGSITNAITTGVSNKKSKEAAAAQEAKNAQARGSSVAADAATQGDMLGSQSLNQDYMPNESLLQSQQFMPWKKKKPTEFGFDSSLMQSDPFSSYDQTMKNKEIFGVNPFATPTTGGFSWTAKHGRKLQWGAKMNDWFKKADSNMYNKFIRGYDGMSEADKRAAEYRFNDRVGRGNYMLGSGIAGLGTGITRATNPVEYDEYGNAKVNERAAKAYGTTAGLGAGLNLGQGISDMFDMGTTGSLFTSGLSALGGGLAGGLIGKNQAENAQEDYDKQYAANKRVESAGTIKENDMRSSQALYGEDGLKLGRFKLPLKYKRGLVLKSGGKMEEPGAVNVVVKGKLHKENNNLGKRDKGVPVINSETGEKEYEVEKGEIIFRQEVTQKIEEAAKSYDETGDDQILEDLGRYIVAELDENTQDNTEQFGVKVEEDTNEA